MALVVRRYTMRGPSGDALQREVAATAAVVQAATDCVDIQIDDALDGAVETLDQFMQARGFQSEGNDPPPESGLLLRSAGGITFELTVDDLGTLVTIPVS